MQHAGQKGHSRMPCQADWTMHLMGEISNHGLGRQNRPPIDFMESVPQVPPRIFAAITWEILLEKPWINRAPGRSAAQRIGFSPWCFSHSDINDMEKSARLALEISGITVKNMLVTDVSP